MSNGVKVSTVVYPDGERKFVVTMFINDKDDNWCEFDKEQLEGLIAMLQERLGEHEHSS
jgi:hypothetical protein